MTPRSSAFALCLALASLCPLASADTITIGTATSSNAFPFGFPSYSGEYQQVYNSALFSGPVDITAITFFSNSALGISGTYTLDFSDTSASTSTGAGGLSSTYANNLGSNDALFFTGAVSKVFTFTGTPFLYNPTQGNLLLNVNVLSGNSSVVPFLAGCSPNTNRVYGAGISGNTGSCGSTGYGLETQLTYTPATSSFTPEPSSIILLGTGLVGLASAVRRKPRKA